MRSHAMRSSGARCIVWSWVMPSHAETPSSDADDFHDFGQGPHVLRVGENRYRGADGEFCIIRSETRAEHAHLFPGA
jgi:hypothetical protein